MMHATRGSGAVAAGRGQIFTVVIPLLSRAASSHAAAGVSTAAGTIIRPKEDYLRQMQWQMQVNPHPLLEADSGHGGPNIHLTDAGKRVKGTLDHLASNKMHDLGPHALRRGGFTALTAFCFDEGNAFSKAESGLFSAFSECIGNQYAELLGRRIGKRVLRVKEPGNGILLRRGHPPFIHQDEAMNYYQTLTCALGDNRHTLIISKEFEHCFTSDGEHHAADCGFPLRVNTFKLRPGYNPDDIRVDTGPEDEPVMRVVHCTGAEHETGETADLHSIPCRLEAMPELLREGEGSERQHDPEARCALILRFQTEDQADRCPGR